MTGRAAATMLSMAGQLPAGPVHGHSAGAREETRIGVTERQGVGDPLSRIATFGGGPR